MLPRWRLLPLLLAACGSTAPGGEGEQKPPKPPPLASQLPGGLLHRTARDVPFEDLIGELNKADVVYVGETHDNPDHHLIQLRILEHLAYYGRLHAIGMEMFQRPYQAALDDYVFGRIGEEELLERTEWRKRWGFDFALYRPILELARERRLPVRALNVEDEIRRPARKGGLAALPEELRRTLPAIDTRHYPEHRAFLRKSYDDHKQFIPNHGDEDFERFYLAMCLWDEVMADGVVEWFRTAPDDAQIVVLAGSGHLANRYGIPDRVHQRIGREYRVVVPVEAGEEGPARDSFARQYADFVWATPPRERESREGAHALGREP